MASREAAAATWGLICLSWARGDVTRAVSWWSARPSPRIPEGKGETEAQVAM